MSRSQSEPLMQASATRDVIAPVLSSKSSLPATSNSFSVRMPLFFNRMHSSGPGRLAVNRKSRRASKIPIEFFAERVLIKGWGSSSVIIGVRSCKNACRSIEEESTSDTQSRRVKNRLTPSCAPCPNCFCAAVNSFFLSLPVAKLQSDCVLLTTSLIRRSILCENDVSA